MSITSVSETEPKKSTHRPRQTHQKSRQGCIRCKRQRKKCDEAKPKCTRCIIGSHACLFVEPKTTRIKTPEPIALPEQEEDVTFLEDVSLLALDQVASGNNSASAATPSSVHEDIKDPSGTLDTIELALLSHYIDHTSHVVPLDEDDYYALHTGMPNLAFASRPLMASLLALAAVCKCNDLLCDNEDINENIEEIHNLLVFADEHHRNSLKSIQATISNTNRYDHVLANAVLMVLYANANQSVRVSLARRTHSRPDCFMDELHPQGFQWVTIIRAAHVAFVGLLNSDPRLHESIATPPELFLQCPTPKPNQEEHFVSQDGPSAETRNLFVPIVAATYPLALYKLRSRVENAVSNDSQSSSSYSTQMCLDAMNALEAVVQDICLAGRRVSDANSDHFMPSLSEVPDWLSSYVSRVTSVSTPTAIRRTIMSFLNRVPLAYIHCISSVLERVASVVKYDQAFTYVQDGSERDISDESEKMAADIFSHWLVFVMFLDGVWWIRDIGVWELGRLVVFMQHERWLDTSIGNGEWWPENMLLIKKSIAASVPQSWKA